jgi:superfamily II DNA or RNA helicase
MKLKYNPAYTEVLYADRDEKALLNDILIILDPNRQKSREFRAGNWDGYHRYYLDPEQLFFPSGLLPAVLKYFKTQDAEVEVEGYSKPLENSLELSDEDYVLGDISLRDYQREAVQAVIKNKRGIVRIAPRGGKTIIQICVARKINKKSLLLVDQKRLLDQHYESFLRAGVTDVGRVGSGISEFDKKHIIATVQTLYSGIKKNNREILNLLDEVELLQGDEIHHLSNSQSWYELFMRCRSEYRIGYSGTPFRGRRNDKFNGADLWLMGATGKVLIDISSRQLRDEGFIVEPTLYILEVSKPGGKFRMRNYRSIYKSCITDNYHRNQVISNLADLLYKNNHMSLTIVQEINHGKSLLAEFALRGIPCIMNSGGNKMISLEDGEFKESTTSSEEISELLKSGAVKAIIGSSIYNEGIDIPDITAVIIAAGGKSSIRTIQRAFRGMTSAKGKSTSIIFDFLDKTHPILRNHSRQRITDYQEEQIKIETKIPKSISKCLKTDDL